MADYNIDKVSPRDWKASGKYDSDDRFEYCTIEDANGEVIYWDCNMELEDDNLHYIVNCVNTHDELVAALEKARNHLWSDLMGVHHGENLRPYVDEFKVLLKKARGEKGD